MSVIFVRRSLFTQSDELDALKLTHQAGIGSIKIRTIGGSFSR